MIKTIGLTKLGETLNWNRIECDKDPLIETETFSERKAIRNDYVTPFLSWFNQDAVPDKSVILLISSPGAVGKTAFSEYLSAKYHMPILDLAKHEAVGGSTMTGLLADCSPNLNQTKLQLKEGKKTIIIDALDEGLLKVSTAGFRAFLDDISKLAQGCNPGTNPFILTGRPGAILEAATYLDSKGMQILWYEIEPFTIQQATEFIDKKSEYTPQHFPIYKEARDLIINSIESFFHKQNDSNDKTFRNFIGYAPVLIAISQVFKSQRNYQEIINKINSENLTKTALLVSMVEYLIDRERNQKVLPELVEPLIASRDEEFQNKVRENVYTSEEQCARVLAFIIGKPFSEYDFNEIKDPSFNIEYNKKIEVFAEEHPFIEGEKFQNVVFESYVLSFLATKEKYMPLVREYIQSSKFKNSFCLYPIFIQLNENKNDLFPSEFILPISYSFTSMNSQTVRCIVDIYNEDSENDVDCLAVDFICQSENQNKSQEEHTLHFQFDSVHPLPITGDITNLTVIGDIDIIFNGERVNAGGNNIIDIEKFILAAGELVVNSINNDTTTIIAKEVEVLPYNDTYPIVSCFGKLLLSTEASAIYPLSDYKVKDDLRKDSETYDLQLFNKIRRLFLSFRCDSKGQGNWARIKAKIDNRFRRGIGRQVVEYIKSHNIIYEDGIMYKINVPEMEKSLGVKFDNLQRCNPSAKMIQFIFGMEKSFKAEK